MIQSIFDTALFKGIDVSDTEYVASLFIERKFQKNQVIFFQNDPGDEMYIIKSGVLKIFREDDSKQIIFGHQFPGETIGELECIHHDNRRLASVAAIENSTAWMIRKAALEELIKTYPDILRKLFYVVSERLAQADRKLEYLAFLDSRIRVVNLLLDLHSNFGVKTNEGYLINWKITQSHFANMIGINRESAARVLQELQKEKVISINQKLIHILNLDVLQQMSGENLRSLHLRQWHSTYKYDIVSN
ncbi:Crp/Fnr family transcriptional regulator [uncultured Brevibacillus sp.]|uniref:Crp/Fnr family transcriptional regulator n=1 Tax=uncultured Brevibacillus sp. TaxID=169970 RepID=UPI002599A00E|nr:Crp/Fnr family transcriptional regulator [uncultured Brevibacillus sp.]